MQEDGGVQMGSIGSNDRDGVCQYKAWLQDRVRNYVYGIKFVMRTCRRAGASDMGCNCCIDS